MLILPAIDLRRGCCVRLFRGNPEQETVYSQEPAQVARQWEELGAKYLHIVDLDGAFSGKTANGTAVERIASTINIPFQLGGGMRSRKAVEEAFQLGVSKVILGTMAVENPELLKELLEEHGERIIVGIDARNGKVAIGGWKEDTVLDVEELAQRLERLGVKEIVYTDINRDGTLRGPNLEAIKKVAQGTNLSLIASGGVSRVEDVIALKELQQNYRIKGVIIGKALYTGQVTLPEALAVAGANDNKG